MVVAATRRTTRVVRSMLEREREREREREGEGGREKDSEKEKYVRERCSVLYVFGRKE